MVFKELAGGVSDDEIQSPAGSDGETLPPAEAETSASEGESEADGKRALTQVNHSKKGRKTRKSSSTASEKAKKKQKAKGRQAQEAKNEYKEYKAKLTRLWQALRLSLPILSGRRVQSDAQRQENLGQFDKNARRRGTARCAYAVGLDWEVIGSAAITRAIHQRHKRQNAAWFVGNLQARVSENNREIIGRKDKTANDLLELDVHTNAELELWIVYIDVLLRRWWQKTLAKSWSGVYGGSGTGDQGDFGRWVQYDKAKPTGRSTEDQRPHLKEALKPGTEMHPRAVVLVPSEEASHALLIGLEAFIQDVLRCYNIKSGYRGMFRSNETVEQSHALRSTDMINHAWLPLCFARPLS